MENIEETEKIITIIKEAHPTVEINVSLDELSERLVHVHILDSETRGFGSDFDVHTAILKAYSEFFERKAMYAYNKENPDKKIKSSNGLAAHPDVVQAKDNAFNELVERDIFLTSWIACESPYWFRYDGASQENKKEISELTKKFNKDKLELRFGIIGTLNDIKCVVVAVKSLEKDFGFAMDTCASSSWDEIIHKLSISAYYYSSVMKNRKKELINFSIFTPDDIKKTSDTLDYYLNPEHTLDIFFKENKKKKITEFPMIHTETRELITRLNNPLNLHVVQAYSKESQDFFIGRPSKKNINKNRLNSIFGDCSLNTQPHPLP